MRIIDIVEQRVIIPEQDKSQGIAQLVPKLSSGRELSPAPLV